MPNYLSKVRAALPVDISFVSWDETTFVISGEKWSFNTSSAWRLIAGNSVILGCWDVDAKEIERKLMAQKITTIDYQSTRLCIDPVFGLSDGKAIEIFSTDTIAPWVLNLQGLDTFIG